MSDVSFRPMVESDLPMVADWLREEHVQRWWKDPTAPDHVEAHYLPRILGVDPTEMFVIVWDRASCRVLEKAGYVLAWTGAVDSDDPSDAGPSALYIFEPPCRELTNRRSDEDHPSRLGH